MTILYLKSAAAWQGYTTTLKNLIERNSLKRICEVGGGANPSLSMEYIKEKGLDYTLLDISSEELKKAPSDYNKISADLCAAKPDIHKKFDFIFSKMLMEHITDPKRFHINIYNLLENNGVAFHFFPTLYALPFLINRLIPEKLASFLRDSFTAKWGPKHKKFRAYYRWCRGPTGKQMGKYKKIGYEILEYRGFFGHEDYYKKLLIIKKIHNGLTELLLRHPSPYFTSFAYLILKKQGDV